MNNLLQLVGQYRVLPDIIDYDFPRDSTGGIDKDFNDYYIPCGKGIKILDMSDWLILENEIQDIILKGHNKKNILCLMTESYTRMENVVKKLKAQGNGDVILYTLYIKGKYDKKSTSEAYMLFDVNDIGKLKKVVKIQTLGASIRPLSKKNLPKNPYKATKQEEMDYKDIVSGYDLNVSDYNVLNGKVMEAIQDIFDKEYKDKKKKVRYVNKVDARKNRKHLGLKVKDYASYIRKYDLFLDIYRDGVIGK
jgi:hypothetical protein